MQSFISSSWEKSETLKLCLPNTFLNSSVFALLIILGSIANSHSIILMSTLYQFLPLGLLYPNNNYSFAIWSVCQLAVSEKKFIQLQRFYYQLDRNHFLILTKVKVLVTQSCLTLCDFMDCTHAHGILQTRYWNGLPFPSPGHLPDLGLNHVFCITEF